MDQWSEALSRWLSQKVIFFPFCKSFPALLGDWTVDSLYGVFVCSTLTGLVWIGLFSIAVVIANVSIKLRVVGPWLSKNFKVQEHPFRVLAALAAIPVFGVCAIYHLLA